IVNAKSLLLKGSVSSVKAGHRLLVAAKSSPAQANSRIVTVSAVSAEKDPRGRAMTRVTFSAAIAGLSGDVTSYQLLRSTQFSPLFPHPDFPASKDTKVHLASVARGIAPGDMVVVEFRAGTPSSKAIKEKKIKFQVQTPTKAKAKAASKSTPSTGTPAHEVNT